MKNIAYKIAINLPNLPDGFITDHFETNEDVVEGHFISSKEAFGALLGNNAVLFQRFEASRGIRTADPNAPPPIQVTRIPEPVISNNGNNGNSGNS